MAWLSMTLYRISALTRYVGYRSGPTHKHTSTFIISDIGYLATHLAMILYNPFPVSESNTKSMITPGDSFMTKGKLYAAQLCYIVSAAELGTAAQVHRQFFSFFSSSLFIFFKFVLLHSSVPDKNLEQFATTVAIQGTKIYEFVQKLGNKEFEMPY